MMKHSARSTERSATTASAILLSLFGAATAQANSLGDLFKDGVFGLPWGSSNTAIADKLPEGRWRDPSTYVVRNSRTVLGIERKQRDVVFGLVQDELTTVTIEFPGGPTMYKRLKEGASLAFGAYAQREDLARVGKDGVGRTALRWLPDDDFLRLAPAAYHPTGYRPGLNPLRPPHLALDQHHIINLRIPVDTCYGFP